MYILYVSILQKTSVLIDNPSNHLRTLLPEEIIGTFWCTVEYTAGYYIGTAKSVIMIVCWINMTRGKLTRWNTMVYPWLGSILSDLPQPCRIMVLFFRKTAADVVLLTGARRITLVPYCLLLGQELPCTHMVIVFIDR